MTINTTGSAIPAVQKQESIPAAPQQWEKLPKPVARQESALASAEKQGSILESQGEQKLVPFVSSSIQLFEHAPPSSMARTEADECNKSHADR